MSLSRIIARGPGGGGTVRKEAEKQAGPSRGHCSGREGLL